MSILANPTPMILHPINPARRCSTSRSERTEPTANCWRDARSVLMVCWGNVCRSPLGQLALQSELAKVSTSTTIFVDSAGVDFDGGCPQRSRTMDSVSRRRGYRVEKTPRRILRTDLMKFDLVIAMDEDIFFELKYLHAKPKSTVKLFGEFLPTGYPQNVPDPIHRGRQICEQVLDVIEVGCVNLAAELNL